MTVGELHPREASGTDLESIHELLATVHGEASDAMPYRAVADTLAFVRHPPQSERRFQWIAHDGSDVVGFAQLGVVSEASVGQLIELAVHPAHRRRGYGSELLGAACHRASAAGCRTVSARHSTAAGAAFAAAHGAADARRDVRSLLSLKDFRPRGTVVAGYDITSWVGSSPDALVESFAQARMAINDAPLSTSDEWEDWDVARVRDLEHAVELRDREIRVTVAVNAEARAVGFTELRVSRRPGAVAMTEDTAVVPEHRGRGLAVWMKSHSLAELGRDRPDVRLVSTTNAEANAAILAVNARLGFVPVATYTVCLLALERA